MLLHFSRASSLLSSFQAVTPLIDSPDAGHGYGSKRGHFEEPASGLQTIFPYRIMAGQPTREIRV